MKSQLLNVWLIEFPVRVFCSNKMHWPPRKSSIEWAMLFCLSAWITQITDLFKWVICLFVPTFPIWHTLTLWRVNHLGLISSDCLYTCKKVLTDLYKVFAFLWSWLQHWRHWPKWHKLLHNRLFLSVLAFRVLVVLIHNMSAVVLIAVNAVRQQESVVWFHFGFPSSDENFLLWPDINIYPMHQPNCFMWSKLTGLLLPLYC